MSVTGIVQARMGSTRLPGKVMRPLAGKPILQHVIERLSRAQQIDQVVVATSDAQDDDQIADYCDANGHGVYRGSVQDVLDRYVQAATKFQAETIVRVTADCPLVDPDITDESVTAYQERRPDIDYVRNINDKPSYPRGVDVEVFSMESLLRVAAEDESSWREHVTPYFYRTGRFRVHRVQSVCDWSHLRMTVDTPDDFQLVNQIFEHFENNEFGWGDLLAAFQAHPEWQAINEHIQQKVA